MPIGPIEKKCDAVIRLTKPQQAKLSDIAGTLHCYSGSGPTTGQPSWRTMVAGIADGVLRVINPAAKRDPEKKAAKKKGREASAIAGAPKWWRPWYGNAAGLDYAMRKSGLDRAGLIALGLRIEINPFLKHPEIVVGKPEWPAPFMPTRPHWWWTPRHDSTMTVGDAVNASKLTVEQLVAGGLVHDEDLDLILVPDDWRAWLHRGDSATGPTGSEWDMDRGEAGKNAEPVHGEKDA